MRTIHLLTITLLCLSAAAAEAKEIPITAGTLHIPETYRPHGDEIDVVFHFQGSPQIARDRFLESGKSAVLVTVYYPGLSEAYGKPYRGTNLFRKQLGEVSRHTADHFGLKKVKIRRLVLSSFSAGYGSLREILKQPHKSLVTDVILADSLYAGYVKVNGKDAVNPRDMTSFVPFAERAVRGEVNMLVTYSAVVPPGYASTQETADFLIAAVGAKKLSASGEGPPGMSLTAQSDLGNFRVLGYEGPDGPGHMKHFHALAYWLGMTSLENISTGD